MDYHLVFSGTRSANPKGVVGFCVNRVSNVLPFSDRCMVSLNEVHNEVKNIQDSLS